MTEDITGKEKTSGALGEPSPGRYLDVSGRPVRWWFTADADEPSPSGSPFRERMLHRAAAPGEAFAAGPARLLQRRVAGLLADGEWAPYDQLDNEIRIGLHLARTFSNGTYPDELSRVVGYDIDADEPFVLLLPYRGEPVELVAGRLKLDQERNFEARFFRAIRMLEAARVVHGRISPTTVRWDGAAATVQLVDFSRATLVGEPRPGGGHRPWCVAEQVTGAGTAVPGDDMWSAGLLTYHVTTGRPVKSTGEPPDLSVRGTALQSLLDGVFVSSAADRPTGTKLLSRLRVADPWPDGNNSVDPRFAEGGRIFDELLQAKFPTVPISPARADRNRHGRRQRANRWAGWIIAITVVIIILVGILLWARIK